MLKRNGFALIVAVFAATGYGQQGHIAGPIAGYLYDAPTHVVRPVLGIPGASVLGDGIPFGYDLAAATVAPSSDSVVAVAADGSVHLVRLEVGQVTELPLNGVTVKPERVVYSPAGSAVALIASTRVEVFGGLPDTARLATTIDLAIGSAARASMQAAQRPPMPPRGSMALSDDGALLLAAANGTVYLMGAGGPRSLDVAGSRDALVAFAPGTHDAAIVNQNGAAVLRNVDTTAERQAVPPGMALDRPAGLLFSADGKSLVVADRAGVAVMELLTGRQTAVGCGCTPTRLERMGRSYRLNDAGSGPVWLLDTAGTPRTVFVPARESTL